MTRFPYFAAVLSTIGVLLLVACGSHDHPPVAATPDDAEGALPTNRIAIPNAVRTNLGITFATAEYRVVSAVLRVPGRFELDADARHDYHAPVEGQVTALGQPYTTVAAGAPLYQLHGHAWMQMRARWDAAERLAAEATADTASQAHRDLLRAQVARAAGLTVDDPRLETLRQASALTVHARAAGTIAPERPADGAIVAAEAAVLTTIDPTRVRFRAVALQGDIGRWREGARAALVPIAASYTDAMPARFGLGLEADARTRTVDLIAWPTSDERPVWARAGLAAVLEITTAGGQEELAIPLAATVRDDLHPVLFRRDPADPDQVIRLDADLGANDGVWVQVLSGLREGDQVVVGGMYPLLLSGSGAPAMGGHFHADGTFHEEDH